MRLCCRGFAVCCALLLPWAAYSQSTIFRVKTGNQTGNGNAWNNACTLQYALDEADFGDQIWVAKGADSSDVYKPSVTPNPLETDQRRRTFFIPDGVSIYGGFAGTESLRVERNPEVNETILSGDLNLGNDPDIDAYHVVTVQSESYLTTKISGFTIKDGLADGTSDPLDGVGGGILILRPVSVSGGVSLDRLKISGNRALSGGGIYNNGMWNVFLANVRFEFNQATGGSSSGGGGVYMETKSKMYFQNCVFYQNASSGVGGGIAAVLEPSITTFVARNCTFYDNSATGNSDGRKGGAVFSAVDSVSP